MDAAFNSAAFKEPHVVFLTTLKEFTVGHWFLLHDLDSAFATGKAPKFGDLIAAVFVCGQPHEKARKELDAISTPLFLRAWGWFCRRCNLSLEISKFQAYLAESKAEPNTRPIGDATAHEPTTPHHYRILAMLMHEFHMSHKEAMDFPLRKAFCLWAAEMDRRGLASSGLTARQEALREYAREQDALKAAQLKEGNGVL